MFQWLQSVKSHTKHIEISSSSYNDRDKVTRGSIRNISALAIAFNFALIFIAATGAVSTIL